MLPTDRRAHILELVTARGSVRTTWLAEQLAVNPITIRHGLRVCADRGGIRLVHGGAVLGEQARPVSSNRDLATKRLTNLQAKNEIAQKAAALIEDGDIVGLARARPWSWWLIVSEPSISRHSPWRPCASTSAWPSRVLPSWC